MNKEERERIHIARDGRRTGELDRSVSRMTPEGLAFYVEGERQAPKIGASGQVYRQPFCCLPIKPRKQRVGKERAQQEGERLDGFRVWPLETREARRKALEQTARVAREIARQDARAVLQAAIEDMAMGRMATTLMGRLQSHLGTPGAGWSVHVRPGRDSGSV